MRYNTATIGINIFLLAVPVGFIVNYLHVNGITIFIVNFIAIIPLAAMLSYATKEITLRAGNILGSLLNATFRNAVKLIITIVKTSLIGIYAFNRVEQHFNVIVVGTAAGLLALYVGSLIILTAFHSTLLTISPNSSTLNLELSRGIAIILLIVYGAIITLGISTALVAFYSKFMVNSISNIMVSGTVSTTFIGLILLLIIRNAAKYVIAVIVAYKDKINLDYITLYFNTFLIAVLFIAVLLLKGVLIIVIYTIITVASWFY
ncbi:hypothetical protein V2W45_1472412 [Cenococcum geophilum]